MKTKLALAFLIFALVAPVWAHAASVWPSAQLEPLLSPALDSILAPLETDPKMPRVEVEKLHSIFAGEQIKAETYTQKQLYQNAMAVCEALTKGMDDRATEKSNALAASKAPSVSNGGTIVKSAPVRPVARGVETGGTAEAIRKKQGDERNYADNSAQRSSTFTESGAYRAWTGKGQAIRQNVMALYTRQMQLEAFEEKKSGTPTAGPATATVAVAPPGAAPTAPPAAATPPSVTSPGATPPASTPPEKAVESVANKALTNPAKNTDAPPELIGTWIFTSENKSWHGPRTFNADGTLIASGNGRDGTGTSVGKWTIAGSKVVLNYQGGGTDQMSLPLNPKGTKVIDRKGKPMTAVKENP